MRRFWPIALSALLLASCGPFDLNFNFKGLENTVRAAQAAEAAAQPLERIGNTKREPIRSWTPAHFKAAFEKYPAGPPYKGRVASFADTGLAEDHMFAFNVREALKEGPTFAGRYVVAMMGCGTACSLALFIDAESGKIIRGPTTEHGAHWRISSRLFVENAEEGDGSIQEDLPDYLRPVCHVMQDNGTLTTLPKCP